MTTTTTARKNLNSKIASMSTDQILEAVMLIGASNVTEQIVVRVGLLAEYERREGGPAVDVLMDAVGL